MRDIDAVTFDHFMTLVRPVKGVEEDVVFPIARSLHGEVSFDEGEFLRIYRQKDADYRRDLRETCVERLLDEIVLDVLGDMGFEKEALRERVHSSVEAGLATREVVYYPDALETLKILRERGYSLGIISNTHWRWNAEHRRSMGAYFDVITLSYEHGFAKPHHSIFQTTLEKLGVRADRCLHVGDDPTADIQGAREAGLKTAFVKRDELEADSDIQIEQLSELLLFL